MYKPTKKFTNNLYPDSFLKKIPRHKCPGTLKQYKFFYIFFSVFAFSTLLYAGHNSLVLQEEISIARVTKQTAINPSFLIIKSVKLISRMIIRRFICIAMRSGSTRCINRQ